MRDTRKKACLLLLASAGLLPAARAATGPDQRLDRLMQVEEALKEGERRLRLEEFLLGRYQSIADPGISPTYLSELEAARKRVFEAKAMVLALKRLQAELRAGPTCESPESAQPARGSESAPLGTRRISSPRPPAPRQAGGRRPGSPAGSDPAWGDRSGPRPGPG